MTKSMIKRTKFACYTSSLSMSVVGNLSAVLFITFRNLYGISYSLLGLLVLINFVTQLTVDVIFSFFPYKFNIPKVVKVTPLITITGLLIFAAAPILFPGSVYAGLVIGTVIFSSAAGLCEVLGSPIIAALPAEDPDREMSKLHSVYAWGVVAVIIISTVFLFIFGSENWQWLVIIFTVIPIACALLFFRAEIPEMDTPKEKAEVGSLIKNKALWLSVISIFLGGAAECTMAQWSSGYLEQALGIPKVYGDIFGVAMFSVMLGLGRTLYSKIGKNIEKVLLLGFAGTAVCYFITAVSNIPVIGLFACAFTGFCTSMLWPGNLIVAADRNPKGGVFMYAMMAAGGDLGGSVAPQLMGIITDAVSASPTALGVAKQFDLSPEQLGMKLGMLIAMLFPLAGIFLMTVMRKRKKTNI